MKRRQNDGRYPDDYAGYQNAGYDDGYDDGSGFQDDPFSETSAAANHRVKAQQAQNGSYTMELESGSYVIGEIINADYKITARVCVGNAEFALGEHPKAPAPFVTWQRNCKNDEDGPPNFFWGHYGADRAAMIEDFCERAGSEYQEQKEYRQNKEHETKQRLSKGKER